LLRQLHGFQIDDRLKGKEESLLFNRVVYAQIKGFEALHFRDHFFINHADALSLLVLDQQHRLLCLKHEVVRCGLTSFQNDTTNTGLYSDDVIPQEKWLSEALYHLVQSRLRITARVEMT